MWPHTVVNFHCITELPCVDTLICTLHKFRQDKNTEDARHVHVQMCQWGLASHCILGNHLVPVLADCGCMPQAQQVFNQLPHHTEHSWTSLIQGFSECGQRDHALDLYNDMLADGVTPTPVTFSVLFKACARPQCIAYGQERHAELTKRGFEKSPSAGNTLVDMYARCGLLLDSKNSFDNLLVRDVFSWTALAVGYAESGNAQEALTCFERMQKEGISHNNASFLCSIKACGSLGCLDEGYLVHLQIVINSHESMPFIATALMGMYSKCGRLEQAQDVFDEMSDQDASAWSSILICCAEHGEDDMVLRYWGQMKLGSLPADRGAHVSILRSCSITGAIERGQQVHSECICKGFELDPYILSTLIDMYMKSGCFLEAHWVFDTSPSQDVVAWTGLIAGYADHGLGKQALVCYENMYCKDVLPNSITFACALKACSTVGLGLKIHAQAVRVGLEIDFLVSGSLIDLIVRLGLFTDAQYLFDSLPSQDAIAWNILIAGYIEHTFYEEGFNCFLQMQQQGIPGSASTYVSSLKACSGMKNLKLGKEVHASMIKQGLETATQVGNMLVDMYARCGSLAEAEDGFKRLASRDVVSWTALIQGYVDKGLSNEAIKCFELMQEEGIFPDVITYSCSLKACSSLSAIERGQTMHNEMAKQGIEGDSLAGNALVYMYAKLNLLAEAQASFDLVQVRDVGLWTKLIQGYAEQGFTKDAMAFFQHMEQESLSPDVFTWNALMAGYVKHGATEEVFEAFARMQEHGVLPSEAIFTNLIMSCGNLAALQFGRRLHAQLIEGNGLEAVELNLVVNLVDMYGRCGSMVDAQQIFDTMPQRDIAAWNALIAGYAREGKSNTVSHLFNLLIEEGIKPNEATCLKLLSACQHAGLIEENWTLLETMNNEFNIEPTLYHYVCAFGLLGRAGRLNEIVTLIQNMPLQPNLVTWHTLMSACQRSRDVELGREAFRCATSMGEKQGGVYIFMSNIYGDADAAECDVGDDVEAGTIVGDLKLDRSG